MYKGRKARGDPMDEYLSALGLFRKPTAKDGSCLFRAVSEQVYKCQALHLEVRSACIRYMERHREQFEPFVEGPFDHHLFALRNPKEWAGQVEISAMSVMFKRDFEVYQEVGKPPDKVTQNGFNEMILLCFSGGSHYDSVFPKSYQEVAAVCQSIIYGILYINVFDMEKEVHEAIDLLRSKSKRKQSESSSDSGEIKHDSGVSELETSTESEKSKEGENKENEAEIKRYESSQRKPAFPYKVAKALDPEIYRNVELDIWMDARREQQRHDFHYAANLQFAPGDKCLVHLNDDTRYFSAHIQEVHSQQGPVTVFIEDLGEKHTLPIRNLKPLMHYGQYPSPSQQWISLGGGGGKGYKSLTGYYQKHVNGYIPDMNDPKNKRRLNNKRGKYPGTPGAILHGPNAFITPFQHPVTMPYEQQHAMAHTPMQQQPPQQQHNASQQQFGERSARPPQRFSSPSKTAPRFNRMNQENMADIGGQGSLGNRNKPVPEYQQQLSRQPWSDRPPPSGRGRGRYSGRGSPKAYFGHTPEEREERKAIEESVALYELQKRDTTAFPALPVSQQSPAPSGPMSFWGKYKKDNRRSPTPPINTPSGGHHIEEQSQAFIQDGDLSEQMQDLGFVEEGFPVDDGFESPHVRKMMSSPHDQFVQRPFDDQPQQFQAPNRQIHAPQQQQQQQQPPPLPPQQQQLHLQQQSPYSSSPTSVGSMTRMSASPVPPAPVMVANNYIPFGMPMYPMFIPFTENLTGPVNYASSPSRDIYGSDLPHSDVNTMRFFFNIGVEYYHRYMSLVQMQQQAQQDAIVYNMPMGPPQPPPPQAQPQTVIVSQSQGSPGGTEVTYGMYSPDEHYVSDGASSQDETDEHFDHRELDGRSVNHPIPYSSADFVDPSIIHQVPAHPSSTFQNLISEKLRVDTSSLGFSQQPNLPQDISSMVNDPPSPLLNTGKGYSEPTQHNKEGFKQRRYSGGSSRYKSPPRFRNMRNAQAQSQQNQSESVPIPSQQRQYSASSALHGTSQSVPSNLNAPLHSYGSSPQGMSIPPHTHNIPPRLMHSTAAANPLQSSPSHTGPGMPYYADASSSSNSQSSVPATSSFNNPSSSQACTTTTTADHFMPPAVSYDNAAPANYRLPPQVHQNAGPWQQASNSSAYMYPASPP